MRNLYTFGLFLALVGANPVLAQKTNVDWDKAAEFSKYRTYAWTEGTNAKNPLIHDRIVAAIEAQLAAKGLQKPQDGQNPDLFVLYHAATGVETQLNTHSMDNGWGWRWGGVPSMSTTTVDKIPVGQMTVDLVDAQTKKLVWMGNASDTLSDKPEKNEKKINKAAEKLFKKYPPPVKK